MQSYNSSLSRDKSNLQTQVRFLDSQITSLNNQSRSLISDVNSWKNEFNRLKNQTESQIAKGSYIIYSGNLQNKGSYNNHILWIGQQNQYYFSLYDLSGGDVDFVILDQNFNEIEGTKKTSSGGDTLTFTLNTGTYYVKVYLYSENPTSYKMSIYRY